MDENNNKIKPPTIDCPECIGAGSVWEGDINSPKYDEYVACETCNGEGKVIAIYEEYDEDEELPTYENL